MDGGLSEPIPASNLLSIPPGATSSSTVASPSHPFDPRPPHYPPAAAKRSSTSTSSVAEPAGRTPGARSRRVSSDSASRRAYGSRGATRSCSMEEMMTSGAGSRRSSASSNPRRSGAWVDGALDSSAGPAAADTDGSKGETAAAPTLVLPEAAIPGQDSPAVDPARFTAAGGLGNTVRGIIHKFLPKNAPKGESTRFAKARGWLSSEDHHDELARLARRQHYMVLWSTKRVAAFNEFTTNVWKQLAIAASFPFITLLFGIAVFVLPFADVSEGLEANWVHFIALGYGASLVFQVPVSLIENMTRIPFTFKQVILAIVPGGVLTSVLAWTISWGMDAYPFAFVPVSCGFPGFLLTIVIVYFLLPKALRRFHRVRVQIATAVTVSTLTLVVMACWAAHRLGFVALADQGLWQSAFTLLLPVMKFSFRWLFGKVAMLCDPDLGPSLLFIVEYFNAIFVTTLMTDTTMLSGILLVSYDVVGNLIHCWQLYLGYALLGVVKKGTTECSCCCMSRGTTVPSRRSVQPLSRPELVGHIRTDGVLRANASVGMIPALPPVLVEVVSDPASEDKGSPGRLSPLPGRPHARTHLVPITEVDNSMEIVPVDDGLPGAAGEASMFSSEGMGSDLRPLASERPSLAPAPRLSAPPAAVRLRTSSPVMLHPHVALCSGRLRQAGGEAKELGGSTGSLGPSGERSLSHRMEMQRRAEIQKQAEIVQRWRLRQAEVILLAEFVEIVTPIQYGFFMLFAYYGYNKHSFIFFSDMPEDEFISGLTWVGILAVVEIFGFVLLLWLLYKLQGWSPLKQLTFVLTEHWWLLGSSTVLMFVYTVALIVKNNGCDFTFKFEWMH